MKRVIIILVIAMGLVSAQAFAGQAERKDFQVAKDVIKKINTYERFSIFDDVNVQVSGGLVTLTGVVNSEVDKLRAKSPASFSGAFSVKSELRTNAEARAEVEQAGD